MISYLVQFRKNLPSICMPVEYDLRYHIDISLDTDKWAMYYNCLTGQIINCEDFYNKMMKENSILSQLTMARIKRNIQDGN